MDILLQQIAESYLFLFMHAQPVLFIHLYTYLFIYLFIYL